MNQLPRTDRILLALGIFFFLTSGYLFMFETDRIGRMLGFFSDAEQAPVARVGVVETNARRKKFTSPEFQNLMGKETIFNKDTLMTGKDSVMLTFFDGSVLEIAPESLVQIDTRENTDVPGTFSLSIKVEKGNVTGKTSDMIRVIQGGKESVLTPSLKAKTIKARGTDQGDPTKYVCTSRFIASDEHRTATLPGGIFKECPVLRFPENSSSVSSGTLTLFTWSALTLRDVFQFELSLDPGFNTTIYSQQTEQNFIRYRLKDAALYYWRVKELNTHTISDVYKVETK